MAYILQLLNPIIYKERRPAYEKTTLHMYFAWICVCIGPN